MDRASRPRDDYDEYDREYRPSRRRGEKPGKAQAIAIMTLIGGILACMVALTAVLISTLLAVRKTAQRAESVLAIVEREIRPMAGELEQLTGELQKLSHKANDSLDRIGQVVDRVEDISLSAARVAAAIGGLTRVGQYAGIAVGLKRGVEVFLDRIKDRRH